MKRALLTFLFAAWPVWVDAQGTDAKTQAEAALRDGVPQTAIAPLREALRKGQGDRSALAHLLSRLHLAAGQPEEALKTLETSGNPGSTEWKILRAAALVAQGVADSAAEVLEPLAQANAEAALLLARIRTERGNNRAALALLEGVSLPEVSNAPTARLLLDLRLSSGQTAAAAQLLRLLEQRQLLPPAEVMTGKGRLLLLEKQPAEATSAFEAALAAPGIAPHVRDNARLGLSRAAQALGDNEKARGILREALGAGTTPAALRQTMEEWIALENTAGADPSGDLRSWSADGQTARGIEAALQLAQIDLATKGTEAASKALQGLLEREDLEPSQKRRAELLTIEAKIAAGEEVDALAMLDALDDASDYRVAMLRGRALAASGAHRRAQETFALAGRNGATSGEKSAAAANRFITSLATADLSLARAAWDALREAAPEHPRLLEWSFLMATAEAQQGQIDGLNALARRAPAADYAFQAKLALAEWRLARKEPEAAARILKTASPETASPTHAAALAAAELFTADNAGSKSRSELVAAGEAFLKRHADAPEATDVAFKVAELHSRGGDHAAAETILAGLTERLPDAESAALAKFLAAQAAARSMSEPAADRALAWFNEIAQGQSSFRHRARFEQASLLLRRKNFADALALYEAVLAADPPAEVRHAARMERADILFAMAASDPAKLDGVAAAYASISNDKDAPPDWRDQAACKRAAALARRGETEKALAIYREILDRSPNQGADQFWFLKAGMEAARLLEEQGDWTAAVAVYDRLASASGAQREDLEQRARRLRLEHFIWEN